MSKEEAAGVLLLVVMLILSVAGYYKVDNCHRMLQTLASDPGIQTPGLLAAPTRTTAMAVVRGTVLKQDGSYLEEVVVFLDRDTGGGYQLLNVKLINTDGSFAFYISPVQANYWLRVYLPGGWTMVGDNSVKFTLASNKFWEFRARAVTPTPTNTRTMIPTETSSPLPSGTAPVPPTLTITPGPTATVTRTPGEGATLDIPAAARWLIAQAVYESYWQQERVMSYDDFMDSPFWGWSQEQHQLGLPFTKPIYVTVNGKTYVAMGFLCEILAYEETDTSRFAVIDYGGRQINRG